MVELKMIEEEEQKEEKIPEMTKEEFAALSRDVVGALEVIREAIGKHGRDDGAMITVTSEYFSLSPYGSEWELSGRKNERAKIEYWHKEEL